MKKVLLSFGLLFVLVGCDQQDVLVDVKDGQDEIPVESHDDLSRIDEEINNLEATEVVVIDEIIENNLKEDEIDLEEIESLKHGEDEKVVVVKESGNLSEKSDDSKEEVIDLHEIYSEWAISDENLEYNLLAMGDNCVGLYNGVYNAKGDLLSTLIVKPEVLSKADFLNKKSVFDLYTPKYLANLEDFIVKKVQEVEDVDFYASSVCNLGGRTEILTGLFVPTGESLIETSGKFEGAMNENSEPVVLFKFGENVFWHKDLQPYNRTATGGEVAPCSGKLGKGSIAWECFMGFKQQIGEDDGVVGPDIRVYDIPLDGSAPSFQDTEKSY